MNALENRIYNSTTAVKAIYNNNAVITLKQKCKDCISITVSLKCSDGGYFDVFGDISKATVKNVLNAISGAKQCAKECGCELAPRRG